MKISLRTLFLAALCSSPLLAQGPYDHAFRVRFYSEPGFRGECLVIDANADLANLAYLRDDRGRKWDDRIASILIDGPAVVTLYADPRFRGDRIELTRSEANLDHLRHRENRDESWDHRVSALKVAFAPDRHEEMEDRREFRNERDADRAIRQAFRDILGRDPDEEGYRHYRRCLLNENWGDEQLRRTLRDSREFHNRDFEGIVRKVYRDQLHRDPDPEGLRAYARNLKEKGWTEEDLRRELSRSEEAREARAKAIVLKAYRDILHREPDADGLRTYTRKVMDGMDENRLRDILRGSPEAKPDHRK